VAEPTAVSELQIAERGPAASHSSGNSGVELGRRKQIFTSEDRRLPGSSLKIFSSISQYYSISITPSVSKIDAETAEVKIARARKAPADCAAIVGARYLRKIPTPWLEFYMEL
jgi:hypothetical protein